jgi:hypothetical protein
VEFVNQGTLSVTGTMQLDLTHYYQAPPVAGTSFDNEGAIVLGGGALMESSGGGVPAVAFRNERGASIRGSGTIAAPLVNAGMITAEGSGLLVASNVSGGGTMLISGGATLSVDRTVSGNQLVQFGGPDGVLGIGGGQHFLGAIGGFAAGDAIFVPQTAVSATFSGDSIKVTLRSGTTLTWHTTSALTGLLVVGDHGHLIEFAGAAHATIGLDAGWHEVGGAVRPVDAYEAHETIWAGVVQHLVA